MENTASFSGYNFTIKESGRRYYNQEELKRFCLDQWRSGKTQTEIANMIGLERSTVAYHIKTAK